MELTRDIVERTRQAFADFPGEADVEVHVAEFEGKVVGWGARDRAPDYISDLWVLPDQQGKGIGKALIERLCERIRAGGHTNVRIDTHGSNTGALRLYERCGFVIVWRGIEHSKSMGVDLEKVHMKKLLTRDPCKEVVMERDIASLIAAIDRLIAAGPIMGPDWEAVHEICQSHEGEQPFDWAHALCHRVEGDSGNASYWYRRAGKPVAFGSFSDEWAAMKAEIAT
jgi:[ribosomal protein S18]-alanine N-acetyltransferase